jgi:hypothetical protein
MCHYGFLGCSQMLHHSHLPSSANNNNNIYLVWPQLGTRLHRTTARRAGCGVIHVKYPFLEDGCLAVPLNAAELPGGENLRGGKRLRLRFWKGGISPHAYPLTPSRPPDRKLPALLVRFRVSIGCEAFASGLSCPFLGGGAFTPLPSSAHVECHSFR